MIIGHLVTAMKAEGSITSLCPAAQIYPLHLPDAPTYPAIVVSKVSGPGEYTLEGPVDMERARVQVDVLSETGYAAAVALKDAVKNFLHARPQPGPACVIDSVRCINDIDSPAAQPLGATERAGPRLRHRLLEFIVWNRTT